MFQARGIASTETLRLEGARCDPGMIRKPLWQEQRMRVSEGEI